MATPILTAERAREVLDYNPGTGILTWRFPVRGKMRDDGIAGTTSKKGYVLVIIDRRQYQGHRVAWLHFHGHWPLYTIDHINGVRDDNRIVNLRDVPMQVNLQNHRGAQQRNRTGFMGVYRRGKKFVATITADEVVHKLGLFDTPEEAHEAYLAAKRIMHPGCTI